MNETIMGIVVFYEADYAKKTLKEIGRTEVLPYGEALHVYAETPNPPSQLITFSSEEEQKQVEERLQFNITNKEWLDDLFEQI